MTDEIKQTLKSHGEQLDFVVKKALEHDKRFGQIDSQVDFLVTKVLEHDGRLERIEENMVTKKDHQEVMKTLDKLVGLVQKTYQEITFMGSRLSRVEEKTDQNAKDIKKMKPALGLT